MGEFKEVVRLVFARMSALLQDKTLAGITADPGVVPRHEAVELMGIGLPVRRHGSANLAVPALGSSSPAEATLTVNVNLMGGTVFLDDERRTRALAKEIKRLITEDKRRPDGVRRSQGIRVLG